MKAIASLSLAALAAASLLGCAATDTTATSSSAERRAQAGPREMPYRAGTGTVVSWSQPGAAAGASGKADTSSGLLRLGIKMDDGKIQYVDTESRDFPVGTRVELTPDRVIKKAG